jgi:thiol-disulfide isomerase/thioredoxin
VKRGLPSLRVFLVFALLAALVPDLALAQVRPIPASVSAAFSRAGIQSAARRFQTYDFSLPLINGKLQSLSALKGRVVVLNFWATWCSPCRKEMPSLERLYNRFRGRGLEFLAVDIEENRGDVAVFVKDYGLNFPVVLDASGKISDIYGIRSIPTTFIIDRDGSIIAAAVGARDWDTPAMAAAFTALLNDAP